MRRSPSAKIIIMKTSRPFIFFWLHGIQIWSGFKMNEEKSSICERQSARAAAAAWLAWKTRVISISSHSKSSSRTLLTDHSFVRSLAFLLFVRRNYTHTEKIYISDTCAHVNIQIGRWWSAQRAKTSSSTLLERDFWYNSRSSPQIIPSADFLSPTSD